jgi:hypothetical protein
MSTETMWSAAIACLAAALVWLFARLGVVPFTFAAFLVWGTAVFVTVVMVLFDLIQRKWWSLSAPLIVAGASFVLLFFAYATTLSHVCCWVD